jgi:Zn-dependent metalloprotease
MLRRCRVSLVLFAGLLFLAAQSAALAQSADLAAKYHELQGRLVQYKNAPQSGQPAAVGGKAPEAQASYGPGGYLRSLSAPSDCHFPAPSPVKGDPDATARSFLSEYGALFGVNSKSVDFVTKRISAGGERRYVHLRQQIGGIPVFAGEMVVQVSAADGVECVMSDIATRTDNLDGNALSLKPTISAAEAEKSGLAVLAGEHPTVTLKASTPTLCVYDPQVVGNTGPVQLAWQMEIVSPDAPVVDEQVFISAHKGGVILRYTLIENALNRRIYDSNNTEGDGRLVRSEGEPATAIVDVNKAYDYLGDTYAFYRNEHSRDGIDGAGMTLIAHVRYGPMENAFWATVAEQVYFGPGYATDDVVAHEYTHGVTQHESGLIYMNQSGAINEAFSDIWGEFVDLTNGRGNDAPGVRWLTGEDIPGGAIRSLANPPAYRLPDRMGSSYWYTGSSDNGGVHRNMGVGCKLAYLLTDGATFNGYTIWGVGISRVADLFYEAQTNLLTSGADYGDLYSALVQAAINLSWTEGEQMNLRSACNAVEINNDSLASRKVIDPAGGTKMGTNADATKEPGEPNHAGNAGGRSVWWTWTPVVSGRAQIDTIGSDFDTLLGVYTGDSISALIPIASDDNSGGSGASLVTFTAAAGTQYQIAVDGYNGTSGIITLHVIAPEVINDRFSSRISIDAGGGTVTGINVGATKESGEPNHAGNVGGKSLWWTWTPTAPCNIQIDTIGSSFDTILGVYTGDSVSALTTVASDDESGGYGTSEVKFTAAAGTAYQIAVDGWYGLSGRVALHVRVLPPANDNFGMRAAVSGGGGTVTAMNTGATKEDDEPNHAGNTGGRSVWWTWTPAVSGAARIDTIGSDFDTLLGVYTGGSLDTLMSVASNDNSGGGATSLVTFNAVAGTAYQIAVDGCDGVSGGVTLRVTAPPVPNDNFTNRISVDANGATMTGTNVGATKESGEPNHAGNAGGGSVWWTWTPTAPCSVQIDTISSDFDTILGVYTGNGVSALTAVASDNDSGVNSTSKVTFVAAAGTAYQIAVDGCDGSRGGITLHVKVLRPTNDNFSKRRVISAGGGTATGMNAGATQEDDEHNHAGNVGGRSVWWSWTAGASCSVQIDTIGSDFNTLLGIYTGGRVSELTTVAGDDNSGGNRTSKATFAGVPGTTYQIAVDGYDGAAGNIALHVTAQDEILIAPSSLPTGQAGMGYSQTLSATGGVTPYSWSILSGSLPVGLSLDATSGVISGTPTAAGTASFAIQAADSQSPAHIGTKALVMTVRSPDPTYQFGASDSETSTTDTNYVNKVSLTINPYATDDWIIFGFCEFRCPNVNYATFVQLFVDGNGEGQNTRKPVDPTDYLSFISVKVKSLAPGPHTIQLKYRAGDAAAAAHVRNARICAIRKAALEFYNVANDNAKPLSINSTDIAVLTWTPATTGNYLVISTAELNATTTVSTDLQTLHNGAINDEGIMRAADNGDYTTFMSFNYCANAPAGVAITHKIVGRKMASSTANHYIRRARILALRLSQGRFNNTTAGSATEHTTTQTTFQQAMTTTWSYGVNGNWLFLNSARVLNTSTNYQTEIQVRLNNSVTCADQTMKPKNATDLLNFSSMDVRSLTTSRVVDMDFRTSNVAGTAKVRRNRFYGLPLDTP